MPDIQIPAFDKLSFSAYLATPARTPAPAVIVLQEIFGVNEELREKCDHLAAEGFLAIAPDLFWRIEPGVRLTDKSEAEWARAFDFFKKFDVDQAMEDIRATLHTIRGHARCTGKAGAIGYCLGGKLAYLSAARLKTDCAVGYYGVGLEDLMGEAENIKKPMMLHIAGDDEYVPAEAQAAIHKALDGNPLATLHDYPGAKHAFARGQGINYNPEAAREADARTLAFLHKCLEAGNAA